MLVSLFPKVSLVKTCLKSLCFSQGLMAKWVCLKNQWSMIIFPLQRTIFGYIPFSDIYFSKLHRYVNPYFASRFFWLNGEIVPIQKGVQVEVDQSPSDQDRLQLQVVGTETFEPWAERIHEPVMAMYINISYKY